jgi:hypothetical protein
MTDIFQTLKLSTIEKLFPEEFAYIQDHVWEYAATNSTVLLLLNSDQLSLAHLESIHHKLEADKADKAKAEQEANRKVRIDPASLASGYTRQ